MSLIRNERDCLISLLLHCNRENGSAALFHKLCSQYETFYPLVPAINLLIVPGQANRLDQCPAFQRLSGALDLEIFDQGDRIEIDTRTGEYRRRV